ncbi:hypothetical protein [Ramlibacter humi]|uniref:Type II toxin-antitoxin system RelE/ParE family toxin n=1 Tax=Ramlibacter humi TaxID=2530451 RepID=A0A4Z0C8G3_9BURK|nr:hypothetical protein [Ramlibacter humi]TFZ07977.1 hypothetical protein EZ216_02080 [Ramlibacter humi]
MKITYSSAAQATLQAMHHETQTELKTLIGQWVTANAAGWELDVLQTKAIAFKGTNRTIQAKLRKGTVAEREVEILKV